MTLESRTSDGCGVRVAFQRLADRHAHNVVLLDGARIVPLLASAEGTDEEDWPPSPALQHATTAGEPGEETALLLVGMAGTSHYSASVESDAGQGSLVFDVACRVREHPRRLGSTYRAVVAALPVGQGVEFEIAGLVCRIEPLAAADQPLCRVEPTVEGVRIAAAEDANLALPATVRWRYRIAVRPVK
jgi:hypothetical protein